MAVELALLSSVMAAYAAIHVLLRLPRKMKSLTKGKT
jgi:hypothetical protein